MRALIPAREKPRPLSEPLASAAATNAENPAIDTVDELAAGGQAAVESWQAPCRDGEEDRSEGTQRIGRKSQPLRRIADADDPLRSRSQPNSACPAPPDPRRFLFQARRAVHHTASTVISAESSVQFPVLLTNSNSVTEKLPRSTGDSNGVACDHDGQPQEVGT